MYAHHREVTEVADQLARCFCLMGQYREAAQFLRACLPAIQERSETRYFVVSFDRFGLFADRINQVKTM